MATHSATDNDWQEWSKWVLMTLQNAVDDLGDLRTGCERCRECLRSEIAEVKKQQAVDSLKLAFVCSALSAAVAIGIKYLLP